MEAWRCCLFYRAAHDATNGGVLDGAELRGFPGVADGATPCRAGTYWRECPVGTGMAGYGRLER